MRVSSDSDQQSTDLQRGALLAAWNTLYLELSTNALLQYLSLLGWVHIKLTGDYF